MAGGKGKAEVEFERRPIIGESEAIRDVLRQTELLAGDPCSVLITGPTGVGKELIARELHVGSKRSGAFIAFNCATLKGELLEPKLFGHVKGAFTGALADVPGLFQQARGGTLFLDEIAELPPDTQAAVLRVLQERVVRPVGAIEDIAIDVRIIFATHRDLTVLVAEGLFRQDLYFRIAEAVIRIPPLVERRGDIPMLCDHYLRQGLKPDQKPPTLGRDAIRVLRAYSWPGNVRQLAAVMHSLRKLSMATGIITVEMCQSAMSGAGAPIPSIKNEFLLVYEIIRVEGKGRSRNLQELLGLSRTIVEGHLRKLVILGLVRALGAKKGRVYVPRHKSLIIPLDQWLILESEYLWKRSEQMPYVDEPLQLTGASIVELNTGDPSHCESGSLQKSDRSGASIAPERRSWRSRLRSLRTPGGRSRTPPRSTESQGSDVPPVLAKSDGAAPLPQIAEGPEAETETELRLRSAGQSGPWPTGGSASASAATAWPEQERTGESEVGPASRTAHPGSTAGRSRKGVPNSGEEAIIGLLEKQPTGCQFDMIMQLYPGWSRDAVKSLLRNLQSRGKIECHGRTRGARWFLSKESA